MKRISCLLMLLFLVNLGFGQSNPLDRKMEKAYELVKKDKISDAVEYLEKLLKENPEYGSGWDYLAKIKFKQYQDARKMDGLFENMTITQKDEKGNEVKVSSDSLSKSLESLLQNIKPSKTAFDKYTLTLRKATLTANDAYLCSQALRNRFIDVETDTTVGKKALKYFEEAEAEFEKRNFHDAARLYKKAIAEQPDFYKAALYLGDCFYFLENYKEAIKYFKAAIEKFPTALEPRKYLIDAYAKEGLYELAIDEAIAAMAVYPDQNIAFAKMENALFKNNQSLNIRWTPRFVFPNRTDTTTASKDEMNYDTGEEPEPTLPWKLYSDAADKIEKHCNNDGIISENPQTRSRYLEVYSWEEMLKSSQDPSLEQARKMQQDGYLDCYVLVTCFHFDFYEQYHDFVQKNPARVKEYFKKYIVAEK